MIDRYPSSLVPTAITQPFFEPQTPDFALEVHMDCPDKLRKINFVIR